MARSRCWRSLSAGECSWSSPSRASAGRSACPSAPRKPTVTFATYLYLSATTFITLGFGDVAPRTSFARAITDCEAALGFGFLAIVIAYLPVLYQAFAKREVEIGMLDARASTPPSAGELLKRIGGCPDLGDLKDTLKNWERWSAELLESHLSYPSLMYWRSQHDRQSWLGTLTTILDTCALIIATQQKSALLYQARLTFAMARHAAVDLRLSLNRTPLTPERLPEAEQEALFTLLTDAGNVPRYFSRGPRALSRAPRPLRAASRRAGPVARALAPDHRAQPPRPRPLAHEHRPVGALFQHRLSVSHCSWFVLNQKTSDLFTPTTDFVLPMTDLSCSTADFHCSMTDF